MPFLKASDFSKEKKWWLHQRLFSHISRQTEKLTCRPVYTVKNKGSRKTKSVALLVTSYYTQRLCVNRENSTSNLYAEVSARPF